MKRLAALALIAPLLVPSAAHALVLTLPDGAPPPSYIQSWLAAAKAPLAPVSATLTLAPCPDGPEPACAMPNPYALWFDPHDPFLRLVARHAFYHELGHLFDYTVMTGADRDAWRAIFHDQRPWLAQPNSPNERFAESYALCTKGFHMRRRPDGAFGYDYRPTPAQQSAACALIRRIGSR